MNNETIEPHHRILYSSGFTGEDYPGLLHCMFPSIAGDM